MTTSEKTSDGKNQKRWGWWLLIAVIAVMAVTFLVWYRAFERDTPTGAVRAGEVAVNGVYYYGKDLQIVGYATTPAAGNFFLMADAVDDTVALPVVFKGRGVAVKPGDRVVVEGTPNAFDAGQLKSVFGVEIPEVQTKGWTSRPVVLAAQVRKVK